MRQRQLLLIVLGIAGCSAGFQPRNFDSVDALMAESEALFRRGKCTDAAEGFRQVTFSAPARSTMALRARFMLAECHFDGNDFLEAARQFRRVTDEAPDHELAGRALLRAGDAQAALWKRPELDPTYGEAAMATYRELLSRYPGTEEARRAGLKLEHLSARFAEKTFKNGVFYLRLKAFDSAILYFREVVARYGRTEYAPPALLHLVQIYQRLEYEEEREEICDHLRQFYPDTQGIEDGCEAVATTP